MPFRLFHKAKKEEAPEKQAMQSPEPENSVIPPQQEVITQETPTETPQAEVKPQESTPVQVQSKTYLKAMPLRDLSDLDVIKEEIKNGNIIILRVTPLASKSIDDVKNAVNELYAFAENVGGDIARLGEERVVICPKNIRIWREKTPEKTAVPAEPLPTTA
jgi:uncharacterized protein